MLMVEDTSRGVASDFVPRVLVENLDEGVLVLDPEGRCLDANLWMARWLGRPAEQLAGRPAADFFPGRTERLRSALDRVLAGQRVEYEDQALRGDEIRTARLVLLPVRDLDGLPVGVLALCRDVTEERRRDEELRQARKLAAVDQTAVGLTHDLRNLLTVIRGHLDLLTPIADPLLRLELEPLVAATDRAMELSARFLVTARERLQARDPLDLNAIVSEVSTLLRPKLGPCIRLEVRPSAPLPRVGADGSQMSRLLLNLCLNAVEAMAGGGRLRLETEAVRLEPEDLADHPQGRPGRFVCVRVADSGPGMPLRMQTRLYELFQRGRRAGEGFGVGLAVVASIVEQHDGWLECDSAAGAGTCFHVYLPALDGA
jgi:PAS domain S-box-containing protein